MTTPLQKAAQSLLEQHLPTYLCKHTAKLRKALDAEIAQSETVDRNLRVTDQAVEPYDTCLSNCETCEYSAINPVTDGSVHCYMFRKEPIGVCASWMPIEVATPQPQATYGWLEAVDKEMVCAHLGVANITDTFGEANAKLLALINWHVAVATDPAVNGGLSLQPQATTPVPDDAITKEIEIAIVDHCMGGDLWVSASLGTDRIKRLLSAAQGEKP